MDCWMSHNPKIQSSKAINLHSDFFVVNQISKKKKKIAKVNSWFNLNCKDR